MGKLPPTVTLPENWIRDLQEAAVDAERNAEIAEWDTLIGDGIDDSDD